ncbi:ribonuclease PH [Actinomyces faecalis]|uniref:ribonuclease PH n=1 Tax=Actinomyces faecalis TaxID=2722820 RepID=UPI0015578024|nr:ribonuclease PH [Actinomyces faecalis]
MKRTAVLKRLEKRADKMGLELDTHELTRHTAVVGGVSHTLGRHSEIDDVTTG